MAVADYRLVVACIIPEMPSERMINRIELMLDQADEALDAGEWTRLRGLCADVLAIDSDNADAAALLRIADWRDGASAAADEADASEVVEATSAKQDAPEPETTSVISDGSREDEVESSSPPEAVEEMPESFVNGRYVVQRFLGEGGKKSVYLAHDTTLDRMVAFALIKTQGFDDVARARILRARGACDGTLERPREHSHDPRYRRRKRPAVHGYRAGSWGRRRGPDCGCRGTPCSA
jgi:hypothetical protein